MPTYQSPGVYVEDVEPLSRPIAGVSTCVAGFIGVGATLSDWTKMPVNPLGPRFSPGKDKVTLTGKSLVLVQENWPEWAKDDECWVQIGNKTPFKATITGQSGKQEIVPTDGPDDIRESEPIELVQKLVGKLTQSPANPKALTITQPAPNFPTWATAIADKTKAANFTLTIDGTSCTLVRFDGAAKTITIEDELNLAAEKPFVLARRERYNWTVKGGKSQKNKPLDLSPRTWPEWAKPPRALCFVALKTSPETKVCVTWRDDQTLELQGTVPPPFTASIKAAPADNTGEVELVGGCYPQVDPNKPFLVTSWEEFRNQFGDFSTDNEFLAHAVYAFFNNGGTRCYVARVAEKDQTKFEAGLTTCLDEFAAIDEISIVAAPLGDVAFTAERRKTIDKALIDHCEQLKNRFAVLDCAEDAKHGDLKSGNTPSSPDGYAALYFPWLEVANPLGPTPTKVIPPSGAIAGIYARVDSERGVHKAPANEVVRGALGLKCPVSNSQQEALNDIGVNCIRNFYNSNLVWGARTLASKTNGNGQWKYINVRRFMNFLTESIEKELQWVVFEPNDFGLWQRIMRTVSDFLLAQWRAGALFGETPEQAFFVRCDESTNPPDVREIGQVVTEIGVAVVKPAEFVIFRIQQQTGGS